MGWNSRLSIGADILFGLLPALPLGLLSIFGFLGFIFDLFGSSNHELEIRHQSEWSVDPMAKQEWLNERISTTPEEGLLGFFGLIACFAMIAVTLKRARVKPKWLYVFGLTSGIAIILFFFKGPGLHPSDLLPLVVPISIIAIKHIIMLARA